MRTALRTSVVLALAVPLVASALPASAATTSHFREKGAFADAFFEGAGTPGDLPGNYSMGQLSFHGGVAEGFVETFECEQGQVPGGDEDGENACDSTGAYYAWSEDVTTTKSKGKVKASTYTGTVDLYHELDEESGEEPEVAAEDVPFSVTFSPTGRPARSTFTDSFRDPETGESYRFRETVVYYSATVEGSLDGIDAVEGVVGTYSRRSMERVG
jgi:hypothetical protein